jgi:hypothetical protein
MSNRNSTTVSVTIELERDAAFGMSPAGLGGFMCDGHCYVERTFSAKVTQYSDEIEVEWLSDIGELDDLELVGAQEKAEELFWDWAREQDSDLDQAIDNHMAVCKARREEGNAA